MEDVESAGLDPAKVRGLAAVDAGNQLDHCSTTTASPAELPESACRGTPQAVTMSSSVLSGRGLIRPGERTVSFRPSFRLALDRMLERDAHPAGASGRDGLLQGPRPLGFSAETA